MSKKKVLIVTQEMDPYTAASEIATIARKLPQYIKEKGMEIRVLMPRYGLINERRHRLHEVVRLSGMNIIVNDDDFPLIIKVASLQSARMQVYFLDNEDFFKRKAIFHNDSDKPFEDNDERMVFFCKGVLETVKKFGWAPDIIHCHGWMTSLIPLYVKTAYKNEPLFQDSKVIYSIYDQTFDQSFNAAEFPDKASINNLKLSDLEGYIVDEKVNLHQGAVTFSDAVITGTETLNEGAVHALDGLEKPSLDFQAEETYLEEYKAFYMSLLTEEEEETEEASS